MGNSCARVDSDNHGRLMMVLDLCFQIAACLLTCFQWQVYADSQFNSLGSLAETASLQAAVQARILLG